MQGGSGGGGGDPRRMAGRQNNSGGLFTTVAVAAVAGLAGIAVADHAQARAEGRESGVQAALRWFTADVLGVPEGGDGASGPSNRRGRGLTRAEIAALPTRTYCAADVARAEARDQADGSGHLGEKAMCAICQDTFVAEDELLRLPCFHEFHEDCISNFLSSAQQPLCPCCRHPVSFQ